MFKIMCEARVIFRIAVTTCPYSNQCLDAWFFPIWAKDNR